MRNLNSTRGRVVIAIVLLLNISIAYGQTPGQQRAITARYQIPGLQRLENEFREKQNTSREKALEHARSRNIPIIVQYADGGKGELMAMEADGTLIYERTHNDAAAISSRAGFLHTGVLTGFNLDGQNMTAYVWDAGHGRLTHQEFSGTDGVVRISLGDATTPVFDSHATHVIGTITASGVVARAKGMAPRSSVMSYNWGSDLTEATVAAGNGALLSNHSYGWSQNGLPASYFGTYMNEARDWDRLHYDAPYYLMVKSAGNNGSTTFNSDPLNPAFPQYDKLTDRSVAKNNLVVASANDASINPDGSLKSVTMSTFTSQGPTDDLRIKPDITGNGASLYSTDSGSDTHYSNKSGTSMAAPNITGSLLLLQQHAYNVNGSFMLAATLKGLALHTADDIGMPGPDAISGWGLLNAKRAAETISQAGVTSVMKENQLRQGQTFTMEVTSDGLSPLIASISWTDPAGVASMTTNLNTPVLMNDLDIRVSRNGTTYYPWKLTDVNQNTRGDNFVDPFERVEVTNASGVYTITVSHKGNLASNQQNYSLIVTGVVHSTICVAEVPSPVNLGEIDWSSAWLSWNNIPETVYDLEYKTSASGTWTRVIANSATFQLTGLSELTTYNVRVRSRCTDVIASGYSEVITFTTLMRPFGYCSSFGNSTLEFIDKVKLGDGLIFNNSGNSNGYALFDYSHVTLARESTYTLEITPAWTGTVRSEGYRVWIDFNGNGDFGDPGELVLYAPNTMATLVSGAITIPADAGEGKIRMRVAMKYNNLPLACETNFNGDVEDYILTIGMPEPITQPPSAPGILTASEVTSASLKLAWNTSSDNIGVTSYDIFMNGSYWATETTTERDVSGLEPQTTYQFYVVARDAVGNTSSPGNTVVVTTLPSTPSYCISSGLAKSSEFIRAVAISSQTHISGNDFGYGDHLGVTFNLKRTGNSVVITPGWTGKSRNEGYQVWIDYNGNGDFNDPGELVFSQSKTSAATVSGVFSIPAGVTAKTTRMRVSMKFNTFPSTCETKFNGEVEDYTVVIPEGSNSQEEPFLKAASLTVDPGMDASPEFTVYPNPVSDRLRISYQGFEPGHIRIFNSNGMMVKEQRFENIIDVSVLSTGFYIIELTDGRNQVVRKRFIKQ